MKLSVFVVTYNQEKYIRQCFDSILMQEVDFYYEVVIGEDHGTDGTRAICEEYVEKYPQVRLLPLTDNLGVAGNWRRVLLECKGEYVAMCEGDDYWTDPLKLKMQVDFLDNNLTYSSCAHATDVVRDGIVIARIPSVDIGNTLFFSDMIGSRKIHTASICFRRNLISEFFSLSEGIVASCDRLLFVILGEKGSVGFINRVMDVYRKHSDAVSCGENVNVDILKNDIYLYKKLRRYYCKRHSKELTKEVFHREGILALEYRHQHKYFAFFLELCKMIGNIRTFVDFKSWIKDYLFCKK